MRSGGLSKTAVVLVRLGGFLAVVAIYGSWGVLVPFISGDWAGSGVGCPRVWVGWERKQKRIPSLRCGMANKRGFGVDVRRTGSGNAGAGEGSTSRISESRCGAPERRGGEVGDILPTLRKGAKDGAPEGLWWWFEGEPVMRAVYVPHLRIEIWGTRGFVAGKGEHTPGAKAGSFASL